MDFESWVDLDQLLLIEATATGEFFLNPGVWKRFGYLEILSKLTSKEIEKR